MKDPLNRHTGPQIIRFFDLCFKRGVLDAYEFADDYGAREFVDLHKEKWDFGVLGEPDDYDWQMWRFTLYRWARGYGGFVQFSENYIYKIVRRNYLWYFLPFCMMFYLMGIEEWLEYPNPHKLEIFKNTQRIHWKPMPRGQQKMTIPDMIAYMQEYVYEYRRLPEEERTMSVVTMDGYCQALYFLSRTNVTKSIKFKNIIRTYRENLETET